MGQVGTGSLRHDLNRFWYNIRGKEDPYLKVGQVNDRTKKAESEYVWALRNINIEVGAGEVVGIIGRNGAGKSTLLKILSKITAPTIGEIKVNGRIASLLEVGTGFHPDLTGRENVFMNGAVLGMRRAEIARKFDDIVSFAGVEAYIDTPVKRYSSGMKVRLGFAVAAFLESEILIVDEVLAVGDSVFQKKCIDRMMTLVRDGRTVLFVSHNLSNIRSLCQRGIIFENGQKVFDDAIELALDKYAHDNVYFEKIYEFNTDAANGYDGAVRFTKLEFAQRPFAFGEDIVFEATVERVGTLQDSEELDFGFAVMDSDGNRLIHVSNRFSDQTISMQGDKLTVRVTMENRLRGGVYTLEMFVRTNHTIQDWIKDDVYLEILEGNPYGFNDSTLIYGKYMPEFEIKELL